MMQEHRVIKVLFAVWELEPFFKVGGLGEVAYSLPRALKEDGVDIRVVLPYYKALKLHGSHRRVL
ncbi:MAG: glycogen/starch synthase, partial [Patescibacteria group bacterium]